MSRGASLQSDHSSLALQVFPQDAPGEIERSEHRERLPEHVAPEFVEFDVFLRRRHHGR